MYSSYDIKNFSLASFNEIDFRYFFFMEKAPVDLYQSSQSLKLIRKKNDPLEKEFFIRLIKNNQTKLLVEKQQRHLINDGILREVTSLGRKISHYSTSEFSKRIIHFISIQYTEIQNTPLNEKLINNQITTFKIWLSFIKKLTPGQFQHTIKMIHQGTNSTESKKALVSATLLYRLTSIESIFTEHYCLNLALSGLFSEIGTSLFSKEKRKNSAIINAKIFKYSGLILSIKSNLPEKNIDIINASSEILTNKKTSAIFGQETYYFLASYIMCDRIFHQQSFSLKRELSELRNSLPAGFKDEFKNLISRSIEFFGWEQVPDHLTQ